MKTEEEIDQEIKRLYSEKNKLRKKKFAEYVGKCYLINEVYYVVTNMTGRSFEILTIEEDYIGSRIIDTPIDQWKEYEISKEDFVKQLNKRCQLFIKQIGGME